MSEALIHLFPPLHGIWSSWARDQIRAIAVAAPHLLTHCAWRGSDPLPQSSQDATNPFVPQWELQITLFFLTSTLVQDILTLGSLWRLILLS